MRRIVELIVAGFIGGAIVWWLTQPELKRLRQQLSTLENQIVNVTNRVLEFQSTYYEDKADILYQYRLLKRELEQLKQNALTSEKRELLDDWLKFLEDVKFRKIEKLGKQKVKQTTYTYAI